MSIRSDKPRWVRLGDFRIWEYRERRSGPCVGCGKPTQWVWFGQADEFVRAMNYRAVHGGHLARALHVAGVDRVGRVTCYDCRQHLQKARTP